MKQPGNHLVEVLEFESYLSEIGSVLEEEEEKFPSEAIFLYLLVYWAHCNGGDAVDRSAYFEGKIAMLARREELDEVSVERCFVRSSAHGGNQQ